MANNYVILDSNVFQHSAIPDLRQSIIENLREAVNIGYKLAFSDFSYFELFDGSSVEKEVERERVMKGIRRFYVRKDVLIASARLGCIYKDDGHIIEDIGDKIIGATAILTTSLIYTFNSRDYPRPFFDEVGKREHRYKKNGESKIMYAYFLKPDYQCIQDKYEERLKPWVLKQQKIAQANVYID